VKPTDQQKTIAPRLVVYELQIFFEYLKVLKDYARIDKPRDVCWNGALDGLHSHARNLLDFFEKPAHKRDGNAKNDDVLCEDFGFPCCELDGSDALRVRINKKLSHLTYSRFDEVFRTLDLHEFEPLIERCKEFLASPEVNTFVERTAAIPDDESESRERRREAKVRWDQLRRVLGIADVGD